MQGEYEEDESRSDAEGDQAYVSASHPLSVYALTEPPVSATLLTRPMDATTLLSTGQPLTSPLRVDIGLILLLPLKGVAQKFDRASSLGMAMGRFQWLAWAVCASRAGRAKPSGTRQE